jgi:RimJ/RimL family protein N-acetyltransferase
VLEGNSPGRVFVDHLDEPRTAFVHTNAGFSYLVGSSQNGAFNQAFKKLLDDRLFPEIKISNDPTLVFYPLSDSWEVPLKKTLDGRRVLDLFRKQFIFNPKKFISSSNRQKQIPAGFQMQHIDQASMERFGADMFPWESPQAFLKTGFGFWLLKDNEIACECSSVFIGGGAVEINIHTNEKYRRQGLAAIAATAFISECLDRGLHPNWECWWDNQPSISLAQKLGFEPVKDHPVLLVELNT